MQSKVISFLDYDSIGMKLVRERIGTEAVVEAYEATRYDY